MSCFSMQVDLLLGQGGLLDTFSQDIIVLLFLGISSPDFLSLVSMYYSVGIRGRGESHD